jgi:hypothetical protein
MPGKRQTTVFKEIIMNAKTLFAALSLALAGSVAMASEATQFEPVSTLSRAGVAAIESSQQVPAVVVSKQEATQFADTGAVARDRDEVRAEARAAGRSHAFNSLYVGA